MMSYRKSAHGLAEKTDLKCNFCVGLGWLGGHVAKRLLGMNVFLGNLVGQGGNADFAGQKIWWGHKHTSVYKGNTKVTGYMELSPGEQAIFTSGLSCYLKHLNSEFEMHSLGNKPITVKTLVFM